MAGFLDGNPIFQSTPPARGTTLSGMGRVFGGDISIHAPREGDDSALISLRPLTDISIHAPREGDDTQPIWQS